MFTYAEGLDRYVADRRQAVADKNDEMIKRIEVLAGKSHKDSLVEELSLKLVESLKRCQDEIFNDSTSTIALVSNLRFIFETCITTRLLIQEECYKYKLRYSIYKHQIEKSKSLIDYAQEDLHRLDKLKGDENSLNPSGDNVEEFQESSEKIDKLYEELDEEISLFLDMAEYNGADFHKTYIHSFLESHQKRDDEIKKEWELKKSELLKSEEANKLFGFKNQSSKVEKELKDVRSWKTKANDVGLEKMYAFIYDYTSSLIHSTSYSLLIPNQTEKSEIEMIKGLTIRVVNDALKNLCVFSKVPNMKIVRVNG